MITLDERCAQRYERAGVPADDWLSPGTFSALACHADRISPSTGIVSRSTAEDLVSAAGDKLMTVSSPETVSDSARVPAAIPDPEMLSVVT